MKNLIFEVETLVVNIFQTGFLSINDSLLKQIEEMALECRKYNLEIISHQLLELLDGLQKEDLQNQVQTLLLINKSLEIIKKKITYDELGGY